MPTTPTTIAVSRGNNQAQGIAGSLLIPLEVIVTDALNAPSSGVTVNFAVGTYPTGATGQAVSAASAVTDANGLASVVATLGNILGTYTFTATSTGLTGSPLTFTETGFSIVSLADAKAYLNFTDTTNDALVASWLGVISELVEERLGRQPVCPRAVEDFIDGEGQPKLFLNKGRIVDLLADPTTGSKLDSLQMRASALGDWTNIAEDIKLIYLNPINDWCIELLDYRIFPIGWKNVRVYYTAGFDPIPGDILKMVLEMIQVMYDESKAGTMPRLGMGSKNRGGAGSNLGDSFIDMEPRWQKVIDRYKRLV
jgi:hypothetical protein